MQATRGTPLSPGPDTSPPAGDARTHHGSDTRRTPSPRHLAIVLAVGVVAFGADQVTKHLAVAHLTDQPPRQLVGDLLQLTLTRNPGAAFSTGVGFTPVISAVAIVATGVVLALSTRVRSTLWAVGFGFLLAGVTGNLADRIFRDPGPLRGHVVDFLMLPHWPVFNVADVCINVAAVVIVIQALRGVRLDGRRSGE